MPKAETLSKLDYLNFDTKVLCFMTQSLYVWSLVEKPEMMRQMPPYFDPRTMPYDQTGRFPAPRMPGPAEPMQRFPGTKP